MHTAVTRDNWAELVKAAGMDLTELAFRTGKKYPTVYRYSRWPEPKVGRRPPEEWLARVDVVLGRVGR